MRRGLWLLAVVFGAFGLTACGDGSSSTTAPGASTAPASEPTKEEYIAAADKGCEKLHEAEAPIEAQLKVTTSTQQAYTLLRKAEELARENLVEFKQLQPPSGDEGDIALIVATLQSNLRLADQAAAALKRGDIGQVQALRSTAKRGETKLRSLSERYGFQICAQPASEQQKAAAKREVQSNPEATRAKLGGTVPITGGGTSVTITVTRVIDPVPAPKYLGPPNGSRYVGIELVFRNQGTKPYDASAPDLSSTVITSQNRQADTAFITEGECNSNSLGTVTPGSTLKGCVAFEIPNDAEPQSFQYQPELIGGGRPAEWDLRGG